MADRKRSLLEVTARDLESLTDVELHDLMRRLFAAETALLNLPATGAVVCSDPKISDGGQDGASETPGLSSDYFPAGKTCWQFKAGVAGQPARLKGEVTKRIPDEVIRGGGAYSLVVSASKGPTSAKDKLDVLVAEAAAAGLPTDRIRVIEGENLAKWCTRHPRVALHVVGHAPSCLSIEQWRKSTQHIAAYVQDERIKKQLEDLRRDLSPRSGATNHVHVEGLPGVGKTRFAIELVEGAPWRDMVVCFDGGDNDAALQLVTDLGHDPERHGILVVDEAQEDEVASLNRAVSRCDGRIRLITIGTARRARAGEYVSIVLPRLRHPDLSKIISSRHPGLRPEQADFCARVADGYVKFADVIAKAIARNPGVNLVDLFDEDDVSPLLTGLLKGMNRRALSVVALFRSLGWKKTAESEVRAAAAHLDVPYDELREAVQQAHETFGICPLAGQRRYISPEPLANYLAVEAWRAYPDKVRDLPEILNSEAATDAFYDRLRSVADTPAAQSFAREELDRLFDLTTLNDARAARVWSIVSAADPARAVANLRQALETAPDEQLAAFGGRARREIVWALERLAWPRASFPDAMRCLAVLALAENESYANNATAIFAQHFLLALGGTEVPFMERLFVLDELLAKANVEAQRLVLRALEAAISLGGMRIGVDHIGGQPLPAEWRPTRIEATHCVRESLRRIGALTASCDPALQPDLVDAFTGSFLPLSHQGFLDEAGEFARSLQRRFGDAREDIRRAISSAVGLLTRAGRESDLREQIEKLHGEFIDRSLAGRLVHHVGTAPYGQREPGEEIVAGARELFENPSALKEQWTWLTSMEARGAFLVGIALADIDEDSVLLARLLQLPGRGPNIGLITAYLLRRADTLGATWLEDSLDEFATRPSDEDLALELTARNVGSARGARRAGRILAGRQVPPERFALLALGPWPLETPTPEVKELVRAFPQSSAFAAIGTMILGSHVSSHPESIAVLEDLLLDYATRENVVRAKSDIQFQWQQVAEALLPKHARPLAAAIFGGQVPHDGWFIEHTLASGVLEECTEADPAGVWEELAPHLERDDAALFVIGFPDTVVPRLPQDRVLAWVEADPDRRGATIARLLSGIGDDSSLGAQLAERFGGHKRVSSALFGTLISGGFWGSVAERWEADATALEKIGSSTKLEGLRRWARDAAENLRRMAAQERGREEEEEIQR